MKRLLLFGIVASLIVVSIAGGILLWLTTRHEEVPVRMPSPVTLRIIENGEMVGTHDQYGARAWLGIPYAAPPVGKLRWKPPAPAKPFSGVKYATQSGMPCPQFAPSLTPGETGRPTGIRGHEDCLYLNIWSAPNAVRSPVMVWLHGGGNTSGQGDIFNGSRLAAHFGVVVVTINYRLGVLGWLAAPSLHESDPIVNSGNFGTLDILRALEWVQENITQFGGDPSNVTLFGESAGGTNALSILASPLAQGLIHRAIIQSGSYHPTPLTPTAGNPGALAWASRYILDLANQGVLRRGLKGWELAEALRELTVTDLFSVLTPRTFGMIQMPTVFSDGYVIPHGSAQEVFGSQKSSSDIPIMLGSNRDEAALFLMNHPDFRSKFLGMFPRIKNESDYRKVVYYASEAAKFRCVDEPAGWLHAAGNDSVYAYRFDWDEEQSHFGFDVGFALGAAHVVEIPFVFGTFDIFDQLAPVFPMDEAQEQLSVSMMSYWTEFARTGDPGRGRRGNKPLWTPWQAEGDRLLLLDTPNDGGIRMSDIHVSPSSIHGELLMDEGFEDKRRYCETYVLALRGTSEFDLEEYNRIGCAKWPPEQVVLR